MDKEIPSMNKRPTVVEVHSRDDRRSGLLGTAFFIDSRRLLSARSVVEGWDAAVLFLRGPGWHSDLAVGGLTIYEESDLAELTIAGDTPDIQAVAYSDQTLESGKVILLIGCDGVSREPVVSSAQLLEFDREQNAFGLTFAMVPTMVGGPVLIDDRIAGFIAAYGRDAEGWVQAVPSFVRYHREAHGDAQAPMQEVPGAKPEPSTERQTAKATAPFVGPGPRPGSDVQRRERRFARIGRLPWLAHAYLPDYLREALLTGLPDADRQRIRNVWAGMLNQLTDQASPKAIELPIAVPDQAKLKQILSLFRGQPTQSGGVDDPIFANILLGGKLGLLDFRLPRAIARYLPGGRWLLDLRPLLKVVIVAAVVSVGLASGWDQWAREALTAIWKDRTRAENALWTVKIESNGFAASLGGSVGLALNEAGFKTDVTAPLAKAMSDGDNEIGYPAGATAVVERVLEPVRHYTYGGEPRRIERPAGDASHVITLNLFRTYQHTASFSDALTRPYVKPEAKKETQKPAILPIEPEMVSIKPGKFQMGSPATEKGRFDDEGPQHMVAIAQPFELGRYEVTFDEYDRFAEAEGRKKPDDSGWGRGKRPVINVSWQDAQDYVTWLSARTGKRYRLPTEAEWEYAARAGTTTAYWWGNDLGQNHANGGGGGSQWDSKQTAPVGSFKPNPFELYDTAGNVYEWVQDCWHGSYSGAPADGTAWLGTEEECKFRVVRGGSWYIYPQYLRSAYRIRNGSDVAFNYLGFRIARAL
jgi:formylglycine-generating enzyme required for sulfatase activity